MKINIPSEHIPEHTLYYEAHITINPVDGEGLDWFKELALRYNFRVANLLMEKGVPSNLDQFCTSRCGSLPEIVKLTEGLISLLKNQGYVLKRAKIEATLWDSKHSPDWED